MAADRYGYPDLTASSSFRPSIRTPTRPRPALPNVLPLPLPAEPSGRKGSASNSASTKQDDKTSSKGKSQQDDKKSSPPVQPYRAFLTPARHGQFIRAAGPSFLACYLASFFMVSDRSWGAFMPIRAIPIFACVLAVFMVRLAGCHIGARTARSRISELIPVFFSFNAVMASFWFGFASWLYAEIYMWNLGSSGGFDWVETGRPYERPWLNERPIIMRSVFIVIGIAKALRHLYLDLDRIRFPTRKFVNGKPVGLGTPMQRIRRNIVSLVKSSVFWSLAFASIGLTLYYFLLRRVSWKITFTLTHRMLSLPRTYRLGRIKALPSLILRHCLVQAVISGLVLDFSSLCFTAYLTQPPFRNSRFLTDKIPSQKKGSDEPAQGPINPNLTLSSGLQSRRELQRSSAFYELAMIAYTVGPRRTSIFSEIADRNRSVSAWSVISKACLDEITAIPQRITFSRVQGDVPAVDFDFTDPAPSAPAPVIVDPDQPVKSVPTVSPLKTDNIIKPVRRHTKVDAAVEGIKAFSSVVGVDSAESKLAKLSTSLMDSVHESVGKTITQLPQQHVVKSVYEELVDIANSALTSRFGSVFARLPTRLVTTTVCTTPLSNAGVVVDAIESLSQLCIASLTEDDYGKVFPTTSPIIRTLAAVLVDLECFVSDVVPDCTADPDTPQTRGFVSSGYPSAHAFTARMRQAAPPPSSLSSSTGPTAGGQHAQGRRQQSASPGPGQSIRRGPAHGFGNEPTRPSLASYPPHPSSFDVHRLPPKYVSPVFTDAVVADPNLADVFAIRDALRHGLGNMLDAFESHWTVLKMADQEFVELRALVDGSRSG